MTINANNNVRLHSIIRPVCSKAMFWLHGIICWQPIFTARLILRQQAMAITASHSNTEFAYLDKHRVLES